VITASLVLTLSFPFPRLTVCPTLSPFKQCYCLRSCIFINSGLRRSQRSAE